MTKEQLNDCAETLLETVQETITDTIDFYLENNNYQFGENFETEEKIYKILISNNLLSYFLHIYYPSPFVFSTYLFNSERSEEP